jgi:hypothetical protein
MQRPRSGKNILPPQLKLAGGLQLPYRSSPESTSVIALTSAVKLVSVSQENLTFLSYDNVPKGKKQVVHIQLFNYQPCKDFILPSKKSTNL